MLPKLDLKAADAPTLLSPSDLASAKALRTPSGIDDTNGLSGIGGSNVESLVDPTTPLCPAADGGATAAGPGCGGEGAVT